MGWKKGGYDFFMIVLCFLIFYDFLRWEDDILYFVFTGFCCVLICFVIFIINGFGMVLICFLHGNWVF